MSLDNLLTWMSARGSGSWAQFRSAVEQLHVSNEDGETVGESSDDRTASDLPAYQSARLGLQRLGHVEFSSSTADTEWRVVPPSLALLSHDDKCVGILCGARSPDLRDRLNRVPPAVSWDTHSAPDMPDRLRLVARDGEAMDTIAEALELNLQPNAPSSLLAAIPPVDDPRSRFPGEAPAVPGWTIERFDPVSLRWTAQHYKEERELEPRDVRKTATGLYRFRMRYQRFHFMRWRGRTYGVPVQVGKYAILRHRRVRGLVQYDRNRSVLSVPVSCRPPLLIERALVLCSGLLPNLDRASGRLEYREVSRDVARLSAGLLRQEEVVT